MSTTRSEHICDNCEEPATRRCAGCRKVWYCSKKCQEEFWPLHVFACNLNGKPIRTCYHLAKAARRDEFPEDPQTLEDYGFNRAFSNTNRSNLLGLYQGLFNHLRVSPRDVHNWRLKGRLGTEIKAAFGQLPIQSRGQYYAWFIQNQYILDESTPTPVERQLLTQIEETTLRLWKFTGGSESLSPQQIQERIAKMPSARRSCYHLLLPLFMDSMSHPHPSMDCWIEFGFCACKSQRQESTLYSIYRELLNKCSFDEFVTAFQSCTLLHLMDSKGFGQRRRTIKNLDEVLGTGSIIKSVWHLKQLFEVVSEEGADDFDPHPAVRVNYGFLNCRNDSEFKDLVALYKQVLDMERVDPITLHEAAMKGKLFEFISQFVELKRKSVRKSVARLLENPYPLAPLP
ncbi:hypothetical protein H0H81_001947 [Sphagnurus paluster]|uniref:MYND-type domain-containing protein n=1 Tax=Sphagnurus paluster TaxID=117069 RepID=A0A9P7KIJ0_9AGAR|nr:hypothetical protein H0H81_001947 [Sphagnurus paluster]